ncbi:DUF2141 domain-containing protein [Sphingomonas sp. ac-8]|uniref:DUF2141 domain-containing protein n=1 Tax=Sphingomonas sp. ac-8 TaxID=3242977 RepID=UPI003A813E02
MRLGAGAVALVLLTGATPTTALEVTLTDLRSTKGLIRLCLTADPANFPGCVDDARAVTRSVPAGERTVRIEGLPPGGYALSAIHDENGNGKLDTLAGIPREGFGFSQNPRIGFGPPRFAAARFALAGDADRQQVRMRYLF